MYSVYLNPRARYVQEMKLWRERVPPSGCSSALLFEMNRVVGKQTQPGVACTPVIPALRILAQGNCHEV